MNIWDKIMNENKSLSWVKRRMEKDFFKPSVADALELYPPSSEPINEWVDRVVLTATDFFLTQEENMFGDDYDEMAESVKNKIKELFYEDLIEMYNTNQNTEVTDSLNEQDYDDDDEDDDDEDDDDEDDDDEDEKEVERQFKAFDDWELYYAFISVFKNWLEKKYGNRFDDYPFKYIIDKYSKEFVKDMGLSSIARRFDEDDWQLDRWQLRSIVAGLLRKKQYVYPSKRKTEKFTEKYKRGIEGLMKSLNFPPWLSVEIKEDEPYEITIIPSADFGEMIKDNTYREKDISSAIKTAMGNFLGAEFGKPEHGKLEVYTHRMQLKNTEDFSKNFLVKLKKDIKQNPIVPKNLHSIRFNAEYPNPSLGLVFKWKAGYKEKQEIENIIKGYLTNHGYTRLKVERV